MSGSEDPAWLSNYLKHIGTIIKDSGWVVQAVQPTRNGVGPTFAYTIGLIQRGCAAEILVSGLPATLSHAILNQIAASMVNGTGMPPTSWELPGDRPYTMLPVFVTHNEEPLIPSMAMRYYDSSGIAVVQYVWPDEDGHYPWELSWAYGEGTQPVGGTGRPLGQ